LSEVVVARTHVVLSDEVVKAVDRVAVAGKRGRSRFFEEAAKEKLERLELAESLEATAGIAGDRSYEHWRDRQAAAAWVRKTRSTESPG
jgi:metal-responsive CopG/Arc/MetJ family transcriptional regulator